MIDVYFFSYGSLVNRATHSYSNASRARLHGWRRVWRPTQKRRLAYLAAEPCENSHIDGLMAHVQNGDWAALDQREEAYERCIVTSLVTHDRPQPVDIHVYWIQKGPAPKESGLLPLSYLDVVTQGYLREYGEAGAEDFFTSTAGWDITVISDRAAPLYPRAQTLTEKETEVVDHWVAQLGLQVSTT